MRCIPPITCLSDVGVSDEPSGQRIELTTPPRLFDIYRVHETSSSPGLNSFKIKLIMSYADSEVQLVVPQQVKGESLTTVKRPKKRPVFGLIRDEKCDIFRPE